MGREIRRVPPNWEHPKHSADTTCNPRQVGRYIPLHDRDYEGAALEWMAGYAEFQQDPAASKWYGAKYYWEYASPPDEEQCRPAFTVPATWFQVYETVSEGTPVTPPMETLEELATYLSKNGDFWDQESRRERGRNHCDRSLPTYDQALAFVRHGHAFSMIVDHSAAGVDVKGPYEQATS